LVYCSEIVYGQRKFCSFSDWGEGWGYWREEVDKSDEKKQKISKKINEKKKALLGYLNNSGFTKPGIE
jgi:hypothetical protein